MELLGKKQIDLERFNQDNEKSKTVLLLAQKIDEERARLSVLRDNMKKEYDHMKELYKKEFEELERERQTVTNEIALLNRRRKMLREPLTAQAQLLKDKDTNLKYREGQLREQLEALKTEKERVSRDFMRVLALKDNLMAREEAIKQKEKGLQVSLQNHKIMQGNLTKGLQALNDRSVQVDIKLSEGTRMADIREKALIDRERKANEKEHEISLREVRLLDKEKRYGTNN